MSSYKKLSKADITTTPYNANKQWNFLYPKEDLPPNNDNIIYYKGKNEPFNITGSTTTRGLYQSSIYNIINHLFYQNYNNTLDTSSLMFSLDNYESASQQRPTSSYFNYNINPLLIKNYPTSSSSGILLLSINKKIYGNKILPYSFRMSSSLFNIIDDGNGNLFHTYNCGIYELGSVEFNETFYYVTCSENIYTTESLVNTSSIRSINTDYPILTASGSEVYYLIENEVHNIHIGNIFYAHGLAVITNQDYLNIFPPPLTQSYNISLFGKVYESITSTASVYYKIGNGSYTFLSNLYGTNCSLLGDINNIPSGSNVYISIISGSNNIGFSAIESFDCLVPNETAYCGYSNPFTSSIFAPSLIISLAAKVNLSTSSFAIC